MDVADAGVASPPPYDPLLPAPSAAQVAAAARSEPLTQVTHHAHPVSMDTPTETPHDLFCLAKEYERRGRLPDAANLYLKASMNGHLSAMVSYASHLVATDERAAFVWFRAAAERGDARAWAELGQLLARGRYFEVNAIDAARCWKRAAQMGDNTGKSALGLCYIRGFGVKQDAEKGVEIVRQVADVHNDVTAMKNLAWIYRHGKGVPKNLEEAEYWDTRAKKHEVVMHHISTREQVLFGRGRLSRHSRHKVRDSDKSAPTTRPSSTATSALTDNPPPESDLRPPSAAPAARDAQLGSTRRRRDSKSAALDERDIHERLKAVSEDPARRSEQVSEDTSAAPTAVAALRDRYEAQAAETGATENTARPEELSSTRRTALPAVAAAGAAAGLTSTAAVTAAALTRRDSLVDQPSQASSQQVDSRALEEFKEHTEAVPDPELGAAVDQLDFKPLDAPQAPEPSADVPFDLSAAELQAVQDSAAAKASEEEALSDEPAVTSRQPGDESISVRLAPAEEDREAVAGAASTLRSDAEDQFVTPEQSLDAEEGGSSSGLKPVAAAVAGATAVALGSAGALHATSSRGEAQASSNYRTSASNGSRFVSEVAVVDSDQGAVAVAEAHVSDSAERALPVESAEAAGGSEANSSSPAAGVKSRAMLFENADGANDPSGASSTGLPRGNSYSLNGVSSSPAAGDDAEDLNEFELADMQKMTSETQTPQVATASEALVACKITRASMVSRDSQIRARPAVDESLYRPQEKDIPSLADLQNLLALYPNNPLRADSQVPLFNLLSAVQRLPVSDSEAFDILDDGHGLSKIIVAMLSQHEDEYLQEQGLHAFVRIIRASPKSRREAMVLLSYANCYRSVMANDDVVIPKGTLSIDERSSGAIQAIVQGMRQHSSVRRVQLAGCAALGEVASVSPMCRSVAYDHGAMELIILCLRHRSTQAACTIHDIACRAISTYCSGREDSHYKDAFASAGAVGSLLSVLQLWGHTADVPSELLTTVTKSCCTAIRQLTEGCTLSSAQCVQSFAYHHLVRAMVLRRKDVSVCTLAVAAMTSITRSSGAIAEKGLQDANPLPEVLVTMQEHETQPTFIRKSLDFMESLACFGSMREDIVAAGGIPFAAEIIQQGGNDALLLERSCGVVEKLCRSSPRNQESLAANNGIASLVALLKSHQGIPGVVEKALLALMTTCANNPKTQMEALKVGAPEQVVRSLATYSTRHAQVAAASASTMAAMVVPRNAPVAQSYAKLRAPDMMVRTMKRHQDSAIVQEKGSAAIASFCEADPRIISTLLKSGLSSILVVALQANLHRQTAVVQIVRCMRAVSNEASEDSYRFKSKLLTDRSNESSLAEIFNTALSHHKKGLPETANVVISICATINRLCMRSVAFKNEIGKDGIVEELKRLIEKTSDYRDLGALQPVLATICTLVLDSEDNKNRFHSVGGVEAILDVMQKWKSDTYVLEHCCAALRYSCNDHFGNCNEVKNHNGVRSILGVMELHPENVNVTLWCCLTLADLCKGDEELQSSPNVVQGIRKVVGAMSMFSSNSRFLASACEFLRAASVDNVENQERIVRLGGRNAIVKAMEAHPGDTALTESGAYALLQVQDVQDPRTSVDSQPPPKGLVRRISRDLRRSGSSSNRSNRNSGRVGILGRKSRSFSSKRKSEEVIDDEAIGITQNVADAVPASRSSLINFSRGSRSRMRKSKSGRAQVLEEPGTGPTSHVEEYPAGADDGYGEYSVQPVAVEESSTRVD